MPNIPGRVRPRREPDDAHPQPRRRHSLSDDVEPHLANERLRGIPFDVARFDWIATSLLRLYRGSYLDGAQLGM